MPAYIPTTWAALEAGQTVLGRDGRPYLVQGISPCTTAPTPWNPHPVLSFDVTTSAGVFRVPHDRPALLVVASSQEAVVSILVAFPGSSITETE